MKSSGYKHPLLSLLSWVREIEELTLQKGEV